MALKFRELGVTGLKQSSGYVYEEWSRKLAGERGRRVYRDMVDNDAIVGAILFAVEMLLRQVEWRVEPYSDDVEHVEQAEFVESLMTDMSHTWGDFIAEALTMLPFGFAPLELVYKRREGPLQKDPTRRSQHDDGLIGWRKLALRSQDTLDRWEFDEDGGITGLWQTPPNGGPTVFLPIEKLLLFRTTSRKNNPEGRSILRNAYVAWYYRTRVQALEAIGVERDLAGVPVFKVPSALMDENAPAEVQAQRRAIEKIGETLKNDEQTYILLPSDVDPESKVPLYDFKLAGTGSTRMFDTGAIVQRYNQEIAMTVLADFILLGHEKVGSFALSDDKTALFATALGTWLQALAEPLNRHALPRLYALNGWDPSQCACFVPGDLEKQDVERFAQAMAHLTTAGWLTPGSEEDEEHVRNLLNLPGVPADRDDLYERQHPDPLAMAEATKPDPGEEPDPEDAPDA